MVERVGKGNIRGGHEPRDNPRVVASHADVLRGSSRQKTSAGEASTAGTWLRFCQMAQTRVLLLLNTICVVNTPQHYVYQSIHAADWERKDKSDLERKRCAHLIGRFPKVRTDRPDHSRTSYSDNEKCFFPRVFVETPSPSCLLFRI